MAYKEVEDMLPHPFFGRENNIFSANDVVYSGFALYFGNFVLKCWEIKNWHHRTSNIKTIYG